MATFVLIHGAFHGGWCWHKLATRLRARGAKVFTPDLAGMGDDRTPRAEVIFARWISDLAAIIDEHESVILVGHSMGGFPVSALGERCADRTSALVYLSAVMPDPGDTILYWSEKMAPQQPALQSAPTYLTEDNLAGGLGPGADLKGLFYNRCSDEDIRFAAERLGETPIQPFFEPIILTDERYGRVPRVYIECMDDKGLPLPAQRDSQVRQACERVYSLDSDHSPFFSAVEPLAEALEEIAATYRAPR